ncbi:hypothetical protein FF011L_14880 [Roseimaritima multifibrata]|uniref:Planctomycete cytochrome C n=1 Tax=Roseimaritima multifibrata TaxID=1930274 RepID=A0A517MCX6_9BACT|nr:DUF1592 domain-containing protein [Roseimaritima multifibrata]QDS92739.1 hypothetical protein FF011L_14880 [Roseimaritima multifibrata]
MDLLRIRIAFSCLSAALFAFVVISFAPCSVAESAEPAVAVPPTIRAFLNDNCLDCHDGKDGEGGFDLGEFEAGLTLRNMDRWVRVFDRVHDGEMPPADYGEVDTQAQAVFEQQTERWLRANQQAHINHVGRVQGRRLTNLQLERSLHQVLGIDIPLAARLPDEPRTDGFSTVADGQVISHFQLEQHLQIVDKSLDEAFSRALGEEEDVRRDLSVKDIVRENPKRRCREPELLNDAAVVWMGGVIFYGRTPATKARSDGWYRFKIRASALNQPKDHGVWCSVRSGLCVSSAPLLASVGSFEVTNEPQEWTFEGWLPKGHMLEIRPADRTLKSASFGGGQIGTGEGEPQNVAGLAIHSILMERIHYGPDDKGIANLLWGDLKLRRTAKSQDSKKSKDAKNRKSSGDSKASEVELVAKDPVASVEELVHRFATRAFRRDVTSGEIKHYIDAAKADLAAGEPLLSTLRRSYRALLCSPHFLYFHEPPGRLAGHDLANRLSYFLTASPPDDRLRNLAAEGRLADNKILRSEVDRLLSDGADERFMRDFAAQWLDLALIDDTQPDRRLFREFDRVVKEAMVEETVQFLTEMLRADEPAAYLVKAPKTYLNSRLARYYDVEGVSGDEIRAVSLDPASPRGGLITQGALLKVSANGTTTSPVIRGVWISERILGQPIPPPPQSVAAIEPDIRGAKSIRDMLNKHLADSSCASCHVKIDPPGFALENFDPAGQWRKHYGQLGNAKKKGPEIDPSYHWTSGEGFDDLSGFQDHVLANPDRLATNLVHHWIAYATGAPIEFADRPEVRKIVKDCADSDYGMRTLFYRTITSDLFLNK